MKKIGYIFIFFLVSMSYGQITFEKGYIINNQNEKFECFIKNQDWIYSPNQIEYKLSENGVAEITDFNQITSFQIYNTQHYYKKHVVSMDKNINSKTYIPSPETVTLRVLVEGDATLFLYPLNDLFFYQKKGGEITQLVYKEYVEIDSKITKEFLFRPELYNNLRCHDNTAELLRKVNYNSKSLTTYFTDYNQCVNSEYTNFSKDQTKTKFNLKLLAGVVYNTNLESNIDFASGGVNNTLTLNHKSSDQSINISIGAEFEFLLPFYNNKWAIFLSPTYQNYKNEASNNYNDVLGNYYSITNIPSVGSADIYRTFDLNLDTEFKYSFIELPIGIRHYFNLNEKSKLSINASYAFIFLTSRTEKVNFETINANPNLQHLSVVEFDTERSSAAKVGAGYTFKEKYSIGLDYYLFRNLSNIRTNSLSVIASYNFL